MNKEITAVSEIGITYKPAIGNKPVIKSSLDAYTVFKEFFSQDTIQVQEQFMVMYLNRTNRVLGVYPVALGGIDSCPVDLRLILSVALKTLATSIILAHNHPSSNLKPSQNDIAVTLKIKEASKYMDIILADHIILSGEDGKYLSMASEGLI